MKKRFLIPIAFLMVTTLSAQPLASSRCADVCQKDALITVARSVANTFGPAYVPFFKGAEISEMRIFQKDDYGDNHRKIRKQFGKAYYEVVLLMTARLSDLHLTMLPRSGYGKILANHWM